MVSLMDIDPGMPILLRAHRLVDGFVMEPVADASEVRVEGGDVPLFLAWAAHPAWKRLFEADLQCIAEDGEGRALLSTWLPVSDFLEGFLGEGSQAAPFGTARLVARLRERISPWAESGVDLVVLDGWDARKDEVGPPSHRIALRFQRGEDVVEVAHLLHGGSDLEADHVRRHLELRSVPGNGMFLRLSDGTHDADNCADGCEDAGLGWRIDPGGIRVASGNPDIAGLAAHGGPWKLLRADAERLCAGPEETGRS